jgi:hypothetical protein
MKVKVHTRNTITYKSHVIRKVEDVFHNVFVLIDNPHNEVENAPKYMKEIDFPYASISDAKRAISGEPMVYVDGDIYECRRDDYLNRFKK